MEFWKCRCGNIHAVHEDQCDKCEQDRVNGNNLSPLEVLSLVGHKLDRPEGCMIPIQETVDGGYVGELQAQNAQQLTNIMSDIAKACQVACKDIHQEVPIPDDLGNVKHLGDIAKLRHYGFEGPDADLSTSLHEYGLIWRRVGHGKVLFIYPRPRRRQSLAWEDQPTRYFRCTLSDMEFASDFDWIDEEDWGSIIPGDQTFEEWCEDQPLEQRIYDIHSYYGPLEVFGEPNWKGFLIEDPEDPKYLKFLRAKVDVKLAGVSERREKVDSDREITERMRSQIRERVSITNMAIEESVEKPEIGFHTSTVGISLTLNPEGIDERWPDLDAREQKAIVAEDVAHEVNMVLKGLGVGHVTGVTPDLQHQQKMERMEDNYYA